MGSPGPDHAKAAFAFFRTQRRSQNSGAAARPFRTAAQLADSEEAGFGDGFGRGSNRCDPGHASARNPYQADSAPDVIAAIDPQDYDVVADLDELLVTDESSLWDEDTQTL